MIPKKKKFRKSKVANIFISVILIIFALGFIFMLVSSNVKLKKRRHEILTKVEETKRELQRLEKENQGLQAKLPQQESEDYLEKEARERFNLKKPGEEVAVIIEPEEKSLPVQPEKKERSFWQQLLEFFHKF